MTAVPLMFTWPLKPGFVCGAKFCATQMVFGMRPLLSPAAGVVGPGVPWNCGLLSGAKFASTQASVAKEAATQLVFAMAALESPAGDSSAAIANTSWVAASFATLAWVLANFAPLNSPQFQGTPGPTTPAAGDSSGRIPNTIWVAQNFAPQTNPGFNGQVNINGTAVINAPPNGDNSNRVTNTQWVTTN